MERNRLLDLVTVVAMVAVCVFMYRLDQHMEQLKEDVGEKPPPKFAELDRSLEAVRATEQTELILLTELLVDELKENQPETCAAEALERDVLPLLQAKEGWASLSGEDAEQVEGFHRFVAAIVEDHGRQCELEVERARSPTSGEEE